MSRIGGIPSGIDAALGGIRAASDRMATAAATVAGIGGSDTVSISGDGQAAAAGVDVGELATAFVGMDVARNEIAADVRVLRTYAELQAELTRLGKRPGDR